MGCLEPPATGTEGTEGREHPWTVTVAPTPLGITFRPLHKAPGCAEPQAAHPRNNSINKSLQFSTPSSSHPSLMRMSTFPLLPQSHGEWGHIRQAQSPREVDRAQGGMQGSPFLQVPQETLQAVSDAARCWPQVMPLLPLRLHRARRRSDYAIEKHQKCNLLPISQSN